MNYRKRSVRIGPGIAKVNTQKRDAVKDVCFICLSRILFMVGARKYADKYTHKVSAISTGGYRSQKESPDMAGGVANRPPGRSGFGGISQWGGYTSRLYSPDIQLSPSNGAKALFSERHLHRKTQTCPIPRCRWNTDGKGFKLISSVALWCDQGNHAFSSKDAEKRRYVEESTKKNRYDEETTEQEEFYVCGPCNEKASLFRQRAAAALASESPNKGPKDHSQSPVDPTVPIDAEVVDD